MRVVYDGWPLAYQPNSPAAIHLQTLLAACAAGDAQGVEALVALPGRPFERLPDGIDADQVDTPDSDAGRLHWEQRRLPEIARRRQAGLVHTTGAGVPVLSATPSVLSPTSVPAEDIPDGYRPAVRHRSLAGRLRDAFAQGGLARAHTQLWPNDLPAPASGPRPERLPPGVHPHFHPRIEGAEASPSSAEELRRLELPETYILYHGPAGETSLRRLLDAWSWAAGAIGDYYPLLLVGLDVLEQERLAALLAEYELTGTARPLPAVRLEVLAELYRGCTVLFHPLEIAAWGNAVRLALSCAKPVVGLETNRSSALCGPAAYLTRPDAAYAQERRALGAALLTVVVEDTLAEDLSQQARQRAAAWSFTAFSQSLKQIYRSLAEHEPGGRLAG
jgi:hypothetical protein